WQALNELGYRPPDTQANFVWLPLGEQTQAFADACEAQALSVRAFAPEGVRVTVGEVEANDRLIQIATDFAQQLADWVIARTVSYRLLNRQQRQGSPQPLKPQLRR